MEKLNKNFDIPFFVVDALTEYIEQKSQRNDSSKKWNDVEDLLNIARVTNRLTDKQVNFFIEKYK